MLLSTLRFKVSSCGMSDTIGPVHIKDRPSPEMQSRIDAEVFSWNLGSLLLNYDEISFGSKLV